MGIGGIALVALPVLALPLVSGRAAAAVAARRRGRRHRAGSSTARNAPLPVDAALDDVRALAQARIDRVRDLVRRYPDRIEADRDGNAVRAGEVTLIDPDPATLAKAQALASSARSRTCGSTTSVSASRGSGARRAVRRRRRAPPRRIAAGEDRVATDPLHFASGAVAEVDTAPRASPASAAGPRMALVDGGVAAGGVAGGAAAQRGFATGAPHADDHATGIASLLTGGGGIRASVPGARLHVADVFGTDPAGGSATAIAQALAWMVRERVPVVVVSLAGPANPLLARVVAAARDRGTVVVAAVGDDGPAAPPAYPASYPPAIAVTGVDARGRALAEAGRARHLDYAAPGADMLALDARGQARRVRGTSSPRRWSPRASPPRSATPRSAGRSVASMPSEAGAARAGRGILCGDCRTPATPAAK
ncbi:S8 family serine peptidase [Sphingomonas sp. MMS24-JH45]